MLIAGYWLIVPQGKGPYVYFIQPNHNQDSTGTWYDRYLVTDGRVFTDTAAKYHLYQVLK